MTTYHAPRTARPMTMVGDLVLSDVVCDHCGRNGFQRVIDFVIDERGKVFKVVGPPEDCSCGGTRLFLYPDEPMSAHG